MGPEKTQDIQYIAEVRRLTREVDMWKARSVKLTEQLVLHEGKKITSSPINSKQDFTEELSKIQAELTSKIGDLERENDKLRGNILLIFNNYFYS